MAKGKRDLQLEARWRELVKRQPPSGLSVRSFCQREHLTEPAFYAWRRELRLRDQEQAAGAPAFVPVAVAERGAADDAAHVIAELRGGRVLRLPMQMPVGQVAEWVRAIEAVS